MSQPGSGQSTNYILLAGTGLIWGAQFWLNKTALTSFSVLSIAGSRIVIGAALLTVLLMIGLERRTSSDRSFLSGLPDFLLIGLLEASLPMVLIGWAQERMASSVTAVLLGTVPLFATFLEYLFVPGSTLSGKKIAGALVGFGAIVALVAPDFSQAGLTSDHGMILPALAALLAAACFASSMILIRIRLGSSYGPIRSAQGVLIGGALTTLPVALWAGRPFSLAEFHPTLASVLALAALGIFCSGLVYTLYVILINRAGPAFASMSNYLVPVIGAFIGILIGGESLTGALVVALVLILISLWLSSGRATAKA